MTRMILAVLAAYKRWLSPALSASCRFTPTCSEFAAEAVARHGAAYGSLLALWRIVRCNPFTRGGLDLVPQVQRHSHGCAQAGSRISTTR